MKRIQATSGRWYEQDGTCVPSVTTILSMYPKGEQFQVWLGNSDSYGEAIAKRDAAGERGTMVHEAIETLLQTYELVIPEDASPKVSKLIQGFVNWYKETWPMPISIECFLLGDGYAGTCDLVCSIDQTTWLIDIKTSSGVYPSYHAQTAAYAQAWAHMGRPPIERRGILHLKTTTKRGWQLVESTHSIEEDLAAFQACKTLFHYEYGFEPVVKEREPVTTTFKLESK